MASQPVVEESLEPEAGLKDLTDAVNQLVQLQIAKATTPEPPKAAEIPATDPSTRPEFKQVGAEGEGEVDSDPRFAKGFLPLPIRDFVEDKKGINVNSFPRGDAENFSLTRYCYAKSRAEGVEGSSAFMKYAPWESMYYDAASKVRTTDPITKAQGDMVSGSDGGFLAPEFWANQFYDQLYAAQVVTQLPITTLPMGYRVVHVPYLQTAITISYASENAALATTQAAFGQLSFTARKQGQIIQVSNELIRDSVPAADSILQNHAVRWMALDRDKQMILGTGQAGTPVGLVNVNTAGTNTLTTGTLATAQAPIYTELVTGIVNVETLNGSTNRPIGQAQCTGILGMPALKQQILNMKDSTTAGAGRPLINMIGLDSMRGPYPSYGAGQFDGLLGVPNFRFSQVFNEAAGSRHIIFGDWQWLIYMVRQDVEVMVSNVAGTSFQNDQTWIRLISRYDVGVAHPEAFYSFTNG